MAMIAPLAADLVPLYNQLAPSYESMHRRWLRHAGGEAQAALEAAVRAFAGPEDDVLDAGCGTGVFARRLIADGFSADRMTLLDPSEAMLQRCFDIPSEKTLGRLEAIPFQNEAFDVVTCAWALETVRHPSRAIAEIFRVLRPGGMLCLAFCAKTPARGLRDLVLRHTVTWRGTGRFLSIGEVLEAVISEGGCRVIQVPLSGPAAVIIARRSP